MLSQQQCGRVNVHVSIVQSAADCRSDSGGRGANLSFLRTPAPSILFILFMRRDSEMYFLGLYCRARVVPLSSRPPHGFPDSLFACNGVILPLTSTHNIPRTKSLASPEMCLHAPPSNSYLPDRILSFTPSSSSAQKGGPPESSVYRMTPALHMSASGP